MTKGDPHKSDDPESPLSSTEGGSDEPETLPDSLTAAISAYFQDTGIH